MGHRAWPPSTPPGTTLNTPGGSPAATAASAMMLPSKAVSSAGFKTTVQPAANAGAIFQMARAWG
jgi:hypothetical protein